MEKPGRDEILRLDITDLGFEGKGIGKINDNLAVFVPNTVPGDTITAKVKKTKRKLIEAELVEILNPSPDRTEPECSYFGTCNGCKMQNLQYATQLEIKKQSVVNALERIGGFKDLDVPDVIGADNIYYYRNKLEFSFSNSRWLTREDMNNENADKSFALGYHIPRFIDKILDINSCSLQSESSNKILNITREFFKSGGTSVYSTKTHSGYLRFLVIRLSPVTNDLMVNLITHTEDNNLINKYADILKSNVPEVTTFINSISTSKAQVAQADYYNVIFGNGYIEEMLDKYRFKITPNAFFQTNSHQCKTLFDKVIEFSDFAKNENALDLYCGCGAISIYISGYVNKVIGVELNEASIKMAIENAGLNKITNCEFHSSDVRDFLKKSGDFSDMKISTIIVDPPRSGLHPDVVKSITEYLPEKIVYVSCNPTTQARDLQMMADKYRITKIQPVDMFPHTFHIENIVRLDRN